MGTRLTKVPQLFLLGMDKKTIIEMMEENEYDYHVLPHFGLMSDWFIRYWDLHNAIYSYLRNEPNVRRTDIAGVELPEN